MARHRQHCHQATSERQIAIAPLGLIAVQSWNLMVAHPDSGPALQFLSAVDVAAVNGIGSNLNTKFTSINSSLK
jgi:hypothetical protein